MNSSAQPDSITKGNGQLAKSTKANSVQEFSTDLLRVYYGRLFPYDSMFDWLSYGNDPNGNSEAIQKDFFSRREWSFTIEDDIYIRYQSFKDKKELIEAIQKRQPHKIDIGAVFKVCPKDHSTVKPELFKPLERELVFDIDMTDYDDIRICCSGAEICHKCWPYMTMAIKTIDKALREDFAFKHILWIYSGRRGVHCWVCDPAARALKNEDRSAVVDYLTIITQPTENADQKQKNSFQSRHPMMERAYRELKDDFVNYIVGENGQQLLSRKDRYMDVLKSIPNDRVREDLEVKWGKKGFMTGKDRWEDIVNHTTLFSGTEGQKPPKRRKLNYKELESWRYELVFTHCYARLDANVSKTQNHLLKSAFSVHPKTGRVCIPIDPAAADKFDPFQVPTIRSLCAEVDEFDREHMNVDQTDSPDMEQMADLNKTSLKDAVDVFNRTFMNGLAGTIKKGFREKLDHLAAANIDF